MERTIPADRADRRATTAMYHPPMPDLLVVLIIILVLAVMLRGPKTLPKLGEALGRGVREAKTEAAKAQEEIKARVGDADESAGGGNNPPA
jgi:Sec-independent protein translocase protein TatA